MKMSGSFFLIGPMGAGKSTIGRQLSRSLGLEFIDSDREIEKRTGVDIPLIFDLEGEQGFRKREQEIISELSSRPSIILATGGGVIMAPSNRQQLASRGTVIYLKTSVDQQLKRTAHDRNRPLLQTDNPRQKLEDLLKIRGPLYLQTADWVIETDGRRARDVVQQILQKIQHKA